MFIKDLNFVFGLHITTRSLGRHNKQASCKSINDGTWFKKMCAWGQGSQNMMGNLKWCMCKRWDYK